MLHRTVLGLGRTSEIAFDLEKQLFLASAPRLEAGQHVFVTGLARAGTTILMRALHASGEFASLTYADMPFVLSPNLWNSCSRGGRGRRPELRERAHADGILVDVHSPEAFEEVFWRVYSGRDYLGSDSLCPHTPPRAVLSAYCDFIRLVLRVRRRGRYLAKNNNHVLRLASLHDALPNATFLVPVRDPWAQAQSLLDQHRRFVDGEGFVHDYMTWLGHHEFGATHRPFAFGSAQTGPADASELEYWIARWYEYHAYVWHSLRPSCDRLVFVCYESLCREPGYWPRLAGALGLCRRPEVSFECRDRIAAPQKGSALLRAAQTLYDEICERSRARPQL